MGKHRKTTKLVFTLLLLPIFAAAQSAGYKIERLTEQDGISHGCISCIIQDSKGFIWFGTEGGLNKYDGYTIKEYTHDPDDPFSLSHDFIRTFFEDPADSGKVLWIGTKGRGLNKYDVETDRLLNVTRSLVKKQAEVTIWRRCSCSSGRNYKLDESSLLPKQKE
jgi:ligand-binding sensor domain-containing protein